MQSPELYAVKKITLQQLMKNNYNIKLTTIEEKENVEINQQYNQLFRFIKKMGRVKNNIIKDVVFINCKNHSKYEEELDYLLKHGFDLNYTHYNFYGKSASMGRNGILGFLSEDIYEEINKKAMMGLEIQETVLSKFEAYKHLLLSSCFCIEGQLPYMIVVDDYYSIVPNVNIKYVDEKHKTYIDKKDGKTKEFKEKVIKEGYKDTEIMFNDGAGLCSIEMGKKLQKYLNIDFLPSMYMLRVPFVKGISIVEDFKSFYKERGVTQIKDIWGKYHDVNKIDIILTKSQYKGFKYFKNKGTYEDWLTYLKRFKEYDHCLGIAKWNYSEDEEPKKTRANYQILQTLDLTLDDMIDMAMYTMEWIEKILKGDLIYIYNFLGLNKNLNPSNNYMRAILLNPNMINDIKIKHYLYGLLKKTINEIKIGKIFLDGAFKVLIPDVVMMMEYIGELKPKGCLKKGEMFATNHEGEYVLNRNPHICKSEHVVLNAVNNELTDKWCGHLYNMCMVSGYDVSSERLNGADKDGDLVLVHRNETFMKGVKRDLPIVLDIEDKITAIEQKYTRKNLMEFTKRSLDSRIGEISNCSSSYHNKCATNEENKQKYEDITCLLSVINGKEIDYAKTGVRWNVPRNIAKNGKNLPYFLKYKYPNKKSFNRSKSHMNEFCWYIEKWERQLKQSINKEFINTSEYMINKTIPIDENKYNKVKKIYSKFKREFRELKKQEKMSKNYSKYKDFWDGLKKFEVENTKVDWNELYDRYKAELEKIVTNQSELANYIIDLVYNKDKGKYYIFAWQIAEDGILTNLRNNSKQPIQIPIKTTQDDKDAVEYLGEYYKLEKYDGVI
ncbi:hypothetical protein G8V07_14230 [Clostridium botulinum D/C]|uniref:RNA dependent RNA polymerase n=1 Tax=Clostridium botulinum TaxID=1491 RepID=UPI001E5FA029|nr:hypothetical protein [Clostridium botulinum]MCD3319540.1 hypothetical protein [Clostridium botulinum D/C]MCD3324882.1 hypothetical protein [Clostridium botulinum D/C]MCD3327712.1 hypothetical protein [Clostridium botulinum D/C]